MSRTRANRSRQRSIRKRKSENYPLPLHDWDFHEIEPWEIEFAITHEYARECPEQMEALASLMTPEWYAGWKLLKNEELAAKRNGDNAVAIRVRGGDAWLKAKCVLIRAADYNSLLVDAMNAALELGFGWQKPWACHRKRVAKAVKALNTWDQGRRI